MMRRVDDELNRRQKNSIKRGDSKKSKENEEEVKMISSSESQE